MPANSTAPGFAFGPPRAIPRSAPHKTAPLGQILVDQNRLSSHDMLRAVAMQNRGEARIGDVLRAQGLVDDDAIFKALAAQFECALVDLADTPPDPRLIDAIGPAICLRLNIVPWRCVGTRPVIVTANPAEFEQMRAHLPKAFANALMAVAPTREIESAISRLAGANLTNRAETRLPRELSSRAWQARRFGQAAAIVGSLLLFGTLVWPDYMLLALSLLALFAITVTTLLKGAALTAALKPTRDKIVFRSARRRDQPRTLPHVSLIVALYDEPVVLPGLIRRLRCLNYPTELLDICLVAEEDDESTNRAIDKIKLREPFRHIRVPKGHMKTKPRALNYALEFCRGSIIGVLDAEDAPDPDQIHAVARHFADAPDDVACLQGVLDFYNPRANLLSRCFTLEYAAWFRVFLPGLSRMGLVVPLGGTTAYMRRTALEDLGGWDAHNVTEDADLGVRLARNGYRTELVETVTFEEANSHIWPWIKQRSRWLKGYAMTWAVHMRQPRRLLAEVGLKRFLGFQALFLGTLAHFLLAPVLFSLWVLPFGGSHPITQLMGPQATAVLFGGFVGSELIGLVLVAIGLARARALKMLVWLPLLHVYFILASLSLYRALFELAVRPFFWAKTAHGRSPRHRKFRRLRKPNGGLAMSNAQHPVSSASQMPG